MRFLFVYEPFSSRNVVGALFVVFVSVAASPAQATVKLAVKPGADIGSDVNAAIASLPNTTGTVQLPAGSYVESKTISVSGTGIHIIGADAGTILNYRPAAYHLIDSADSIAGWHGSHVTVDVLSAVGEDHPDPMEGDGYIEVTTGPEPDQEVAKSIPRTNFESAAKIGLWATLNLTRTQQEIEFFVSDGSRTAYWRLTPQSVYGSWKFFELGRANPSGTDGGLPDMKRISVIGFRRLVPNAKYYFDAVSLYNPTGPAIVFTSCVQCSLENVTIRWQPASQDSVIIAEQNTRNLLLDHVHTTGGATGIDLAGPSSASTCKACVVERAHNGFSLSGNTSGNRLLNVEANRNVNGIYVGPGATHNLVSSPRCIRNNASGILVEGDDNQISNPYINTWMTFGIVIAAGSRNTLTGVTAHSAVGESAVQLINGAANNELSSINIEQSGGSGLDFGGGVKPVVYNTATNVVVRYSGSSSWHGGPKGTSEGRGLCLADANNNTITHVEIYETAQRSTVLGAEGIIINSGSSGNKLEDLLIYHSRHEGITVWDASDNALRNVRVVGNGLQEGNGAGVRIEAAAKNTVLENVCYWMNGGGGIKNVSTSSSIRNARQIKDMDPKTDCR